MYWTIRFNIVNQQDEYVKCMQVIDYISNGEKDRLLKDFLREVEYCPSVRRLTLNEFMEEDIKNCYDKWPQIEAGDEIEYVFNIDCSDENDMVNIIYFCLVNDKLDGDAVLCIKSSSGNSEKIAANIKDLLSVLFIKKRIKSCYILTDKGLRKVRGTHRIIRRFSPIFMIEESDESVAYWRQSVHTFLLKLYKKVRVGSNKYYTENYFLPHICPKALKGRYSDDIDIEKFEQDTWLMSIFSECFCTGEAKEETHIDFIEKRYQMWKSETLFEHVKDMSLLAMYIFCISEYFLKNNVSHSMERIEQAIFDARDMAEGLLQILENVYHSENGRGYFCLRVHNNIEGRSKGYLKSHYPEYIGKKRKTAKQDINYLEVKIADYSHYTIPDQFYINFEKRRKNAGNEEIRIYNKIQKKAKDIKVRSFFESLKFWDVYNSISENVVHHYGLQVFESLVSCYEGYFRVRSQGKYQIDLEKEFYRSVLKNVKSYRPSRWGIPGTQYDILLPFKTREIMQDTSLNVNIDYTSSLLEKYNMSEKIFDFTTENCTRVFLEVSASGIMSFQEKKERTIRELSVILHNALEREESNDNLIIHFSAQKIALTMIEMFCKAVILYIAQRPKGQKCFIMVTECTQSYFVEITRMMALFYNKQGNNPLMGDTQIFMSGQKEGEEFLITGTNLGEAIGSSEKLAFARCIHPNCLKILKKMLKKRVKDNWKMSADAMNTNVSIAPFDMLEYNKEKETLFERSLQSTLKQDVQSVKFGCKMEGLHVRIGSKIHVRTFYEAELLFHNNYYTSRFAYWLFHELMNHKGLNKKKRFILVGYENYSEMLLNELCNMFENSGIHTEYLIYEQKAVGKFRGRVDYEECKDCQFVIIVPINSTMTTHIKVSGFLERTIKESLKKKNDQEYEKFELSTVLNYGIILISHKEENLYWEKSIEEKNVIISKISWEKMKYFTEVISEWEHPLSCKACFPKDDYTKEVPLVETSKASVVPMHAIGIRKKNMSEDIHDVSEPEMTKLEELSEFLIYDHIERNGNHFSYYFATEKLWDFPDVRKNVQEWLKEKKKLLPVEECKVYDIIVAPLHFSNTAFLEEVNAYLFSNAALVLHFDVDKEFRMNVKTKYSSVQQLYDNLCMDDEKSVINFSFIDDTIISGHTYNRMKSLMSSLVTVRSNSKVEIHIFKYVVLLLNRMSNSSIRNYIKDTRYFMAYFNLNISSMRVNSDACVLCKKYDEWETLAEQASLNEVCKYWKNKCNKIKCKPIETVDLAKRDSLRQKRAKQYMITSHKAKKLLDVLCDSANNDEIQFQIVDRLFPEDVNNNFEKMVAVLKILGRPFLTFRKEEKEAVFELMLRMLEALLQDSEPDGNRKFDRIVRQLRSDKDNRTKIITMLLNRLAELESNYIIRMRSMNRILEYCNTITDETLRREFAENYLNRVKQLVGQSNDFAKGLFLEYLLLYGEEYHDNFSENEFVSLIGKDDNISFKRNVYLENTKLVNYGVEYLADCFINNMEYTAEKMKKALNENYYFDNFIQYLSFHKMIEIDSKGKIQKFVSSDAASKLEGMMRFQLLYQKIFDEWKISEAVPEKELQNEEDYKNDFAEMLKYLKLASGAIDGEIIVPYRDPNESDKYIALELGESSEIRRMENTEQYLLTFMKENTKFEKDTYTICSECNGLKRILLKFCDETDVRNDRTSTIFMLFLFRTEDDGMLLHALKNLLVFRSKIWKILNLSGGTLLQNWTDNLFYKQQMLKSRAVGHSEFESLIRQFDELTDIVSEQTNTIDRAIYKKYFELLVNSMIGYMNSQVLGGKGRDYMVSDNMKFMEFWKGEKKTFEAMRLIWKLNVNFKEETEALLAERRIRREAAKNNKAPKPEALRILFLAVFQNAVKHGLYNKKSGREVVISVEGNNLCISNVVEETEKEKIEKNIKLEAYRTGEGISQAVIFDTCQSWYENVQYDKMFVLEETESDHKSWLYVVKLPIIEKEDGK